MFINLTLNNRKKISINKNYIVKFSESKNSGTEIVTIDNDCGFKVLESYEKIKSMVNPNAAIGENKKIQYPLSKEELIS